MNKLILAFVAINFASFASKAAQPEINPSHIDAYVTPYYNSKGPEVNVGRFSSGLASRKLDEFLTTIGEMKKDYFPGALCRCNPTVRPGLSKRSCLLVLFRSVSWSTVWRSPGPDQDGKHR
jgi:hypothetical protein